MSPRTELFRERDKEPADWLGNTKTPAYSADSQRRWRAESSCELCRSQVVTSPQSCACEGHPAKLKEGAWRIARSTLQSHRPGLPGIRHVGTQALSFCRAGCPRRRNVGLKCDDCPLSLFLWVLGVMWRERRGAGQEAGCSLIHSWTPGRRAQLYTGVSHTHPPTVRCRGVGDARFCVI